MRFSKFKVMVKPNIIYTLILVLIISISLFFTFYNLERRSLLDWDEAYYSGIVKTWRAGLDWIANSIFHQGDMKGLSFGSYMLKHGMAINTFAKDGFLAIVFLFSYILGLHDTTILWTSGIFGVLTVYLVYAIGKEISGKIGGLLSSGILAISVYHLHYARSGFPQSVSIFFLYMAVFIYLLAERRIDDEKKDGGGLLFLSGISMGYAFTCHYNLFWAFPCFFILETRRYFLYYRKASLMKFLKRIFLLCGGVLIPVIFWSIFSEIVKFILYLNPSSREAISGSLGTGKFVTYFDRILNFLAPSLPKGAYVNETGYAVNQIDPLFYVKLLKLWDDFLIIILLLSGIVYLGYRQIRNNFFKELVILTLFLTPFFYWSLHGWQMSRSFAGAIPAMALIIGMFLTRLIEIVFKKEGFKIMITMICLLVLAFLSVNRIKKELSYASGYPAAIKFMKEHSGIRHLSSQYTISRFFTGRENALDISVSFASKDIKVKLKELYEKDNYRYLLLDQMRYAFINSPIVKAADQSKPVFTASHSSEANLFENDMAGFVEVIRREPQVIKVYNLEDIIAKVND